MEKRLSRNGFVLSFVFSILALFIIWFFAFIRNPEGLQREVFFADRNDWFMDFYNTVYYSVGKQPYSWGWLPARNYLPLAYLIVYPFSFLYPYNTEGGDTQYTARYSQLPGIAGAVVLAFSICFTFYFLYRLSKGKEYQKVSLMLALLVSRIMIYNYDRFNQIILVAGLIAVFFLLEDHNNTVLKHIGLLCLAAAAVLKIFPAFFGVILIFKKRYKEIGFLLLYAFLLAFLPFFWLNGSLQDNIHGYLRALKAHAEAYKGGAFGLGSPTVFWDGASIPSVVSYGIAIAACMLSRFQRQEWKKVLMICLAAQLASGQQSYYCMILFFIPLILFMNEDGHKRSDIIYLVWFILLMNPIQFRLLDGRINNLRVMNTCLLIMYTYFLIKTIIHWIRGRSCVTGKGAAGETIRYGEQK